jgi:PAS domain S-box-containing protein
MHETLTPSPAWCGEVLDVIRPVICLLDERGRLIRANRAMLETIGAQPESVEGSSFWSLPWPALSREHRRMLKLAVSQAAEGGLVKQELDLSRQGHPAMSLDITIRPISSEDGGVHWILVEGRDTTAYRQTIDALYHSEARFKTIFEEADLGIVLKGIDGTMLDSNPFFQAMLGYTANELAHRNYLSITHPLDKVVSRRLFRQLVTGQRQSYTLEKRYVTKDGQTVWGRITTSMVREQKKDDRFVIGIVENITAQKQVEAELAELQRHLMQGREMEQRRIAQDLHDGPLQEIIALSYQVKDLEGTLAGETGHEQLQTILTGIQSLARSVRTICGELRPPTLAPFGLQKTIQSHAEEFRAAHPEVSLTLDLARDDQKIPEQVRIVLFRIYQEALHNVLRHSEANAVTVQFRLGAKRALLEIQDNGVGFDLPNHWINLARQGHLGLVGAMERAGDIGGRMRIKTALGHGTAIQVIVPIKDEGALPPNPKGREA